MIYLADRVRAKVTDASLDHSFVLLRGTLLTVVGSEFRKVRTHLLQRQAAIAIEHKDACWIGTKRVKLAPILAIGVV
jgi:hypothetical protein